MINCHEHNTAMLTPI